MMRPALYLMVCASLILSCRSVPAPSPRHPAFETHDTQVAAPQSRTFTDEDLARAIRQFPAGAIYVWSPGMPLSAKALAHIRAAAKRTGTQLITLVDPRVKGMDLAGIGKATGEDPKTFIYIGSYQLMDARMMMHFPTAIYFAGGKLSDRTFVGYKETAEYQEWMIREARKLTGTP